MKFKSMDKRVNWTVKELEVLCELVKEHFGVLLNRKTDAINNEMKRNAWIDITNSFNLSPGVTTKRKTKQLQEKYKNAKRLSNKHKEQDGLEVFKIDMRHININSSSSDVKIAEVGAISQKNKEQDRIEFGREFSNLNSLSTDIKIAEVGVKLEPLPFNGDSNSHYYQLTSSLSDAQLHFPESAAASSPSLSRVSAPDVTIGDVAIDDVAISDVRNTTAKDGDSSTAEDSVVDIRVPLFKKNRELKRKKIASARAAEEIIETTRSRKLAIEAEAEVTIRIKEEEHEMKMKVLQAKLEAQEAKKQYYIKLANSIS